MGDFAFSSLPPEIQLRILSFLDAKDAYTSHCVSNYWNSFIEELWKHYVERDYKHYLTTRPTFTTHPMYPTLDVENYLSELDALWGLPLFHVHSILSSDSWLAVQGEFNLPALVLRHYGSYGQPIRELTADIRNEDLKQTIESGYISQQPIAWKQYHAELRKTVNLNGVWKGEYGGHGIEIVRVVHRGYFVEGIKIKGDINVPSGKTTFRMLLKRDDPRVGIGKIHLASVGFLNPHWGFATLHVTSRRNFYVEWYISPGRTVCTQFWWFKEQFEEETPAPTPTNAKT